MAFAANSVHFLFLCLAVAVFPAVDVSAAGGSARGDDEAVLVDPRLGLAFPRVVREAARLLENGACRLLLRDFSDDRTGLPLEETLAALDTSPAIFLRSIRFRSGREDPRCFSPYRMAYVVPGNRDVVICPALYNGVHRQYGDSTVVIVLHEALHAMGLGENPPGSREITTAVEHRCSR